MIHLAETDKLVTANFITAMVLAFKTLGITIDLASRTTGSEIVGIYEEMGAGVPMEELPSDMAGLLKELTEMMNDFWGYDLVASDVTEKGYTLTSNNCPFADYTATMIDVGVNPPFCMIYGLQGAIIEEKTNTSPFIVKVDHTTEKCVLKIEF